LVLLLLLLLLHAPPQNPKEKGALFQKTDVGKKRKKDIFLHVTLLLGAPKQEKTRHG